MNPQGRGQYRVIKNCKNIFLFSHKILHSFGVTIPEISAQVIQPDDHQVFAQSMGLLAPPVNPVAWTSDFWNATDDNGHAVTPFKQIVINLIPYKCIKYRNVLDKHQYS